MRGDFRKVNFIKLRSLIARGWRATTDLVKLISAHLTTHNVLSKVRKRRRLAHDAGESFVAALAQLAEEKRFFVLHEPVRKLLRLAQAEPKDEVGGDVVKSRFTETRRNGRHYVQTLLFQKRIHRTFKPLEFLLYQTQH